ncbi:hypothetical protein FRC18_006734, partial [Serendipita sp. 400]
MRRACLRIGSDLSGMESELDAGLWRDPLIDPETCKTGSLYLPVGTWASHEDPRVAPLLKYVGALIRQDFIGTMKSIVPLMVKVGWTKNDVETWRRNLIQDLTDLHVHTVLRVRLAWGRKRPISEGRSAEQAPDTEGKPDSPSRSRRKCARRERTILSSH